MRRLKLCMTVLLWYWAQPKHWKTSMTQVICISIWSQRISWQSKTVWILFSCSILTPWSAWKIWRMLCTAIMHQRSVHPTPKDMRLWSSRPGSFVRLAGILTCIVLVQYYLKPCGIERPMPLTAKNTLNTIFRLLCMLGKTIKTVFSVRWLSSSIKHSPAIMETDIRMPVRPSNSFKQYLHSLMKRNHGSGQLQSSPVLPFMDGKWNCSIWQTSLTRMLATFAVCMGWAVLVKVRWSSNI